MLCNFCMEDASLACSACHVTRYCSIECQKADWKTHKKGCKMQQMCNEINKKMEIEPPKRPPVGRCTGCNVKFDEEDYYCDDACETCGYQACESCVSDTSNGTCYCPNQNFGRPYCIMSPRWYHADRNGKSYRGDRHPPVDDEYSSDQFEPEPRKCGNCGEETRMLKKEFCA